jgi:hypothetical protein
MSQIKDLKSDTVLNIKFAELAVPLFHAGINLSSKLETGKRGVKLEYDVVRGFLYVTVNNKTALIPYSNIASMSLPDEQPVHAEATPKPIAKSASVPLASPRAAAIPTTPAAKTASPAQVSDPVRDGVFGAGK